VTIEVPGWVRDAVFYEVFPDRFAASPRVSKLGHLEPWDAPPTHTGFKGGDLLGIVEHLDHIADLGANALYLTPVFESAANHRYHTYDYLHVDPLFGGDLALQELLDAVHARGMRLVLDGVFDHTGRGFYPFHHVLETGAASPYREWFRFDQGRLDGGGTIDAYPNGNAWNWQGDPHAQLGYDAWWGVPALPKLNIDHPDVREFIYGVAEHWLRLGIDGWRLDVPGEIHDRPFWAEFRRRCKAVNPEAYLVGEIWDVAPDWVDGDRFDGLMNYPLAEAIIGYVGGDSLDEPLLRSHSEYAKTVRLDGPGFTWRLGELFGAYGPESSSGHLNVLASHDTPRILSLLGADRAGLELAVVLQATLPGAPCVYYGDEIGLLGGLDPDCRRAFPWEPERWDDAILASTRAAFQLRRREAALRRGEIRLGQAVDRAMAFERALGGDRLSVGLNAGTEPVRLELATGGDPGRHAKVLLTTGAAGNPFIDADGTASIELAGRSAVVVRVPRA